MMTSCEPRFATARSPERKSLGRAAGKIARLLGQPLMPWQREVLDVALELAEDGRLAYRDVTLTVPRQQGKSFLLLVVMLTRALLEPRQSIAYTAQTALDARRKLLDDWTPMVKSSALGSQATVYLAPGRESITLSNGSQIALVASTSKAGHGRVLDQAVLDEAFAYPDARTEQALRPAMMTRPDPQLWVVSTAGTPDASPYLLERVERGRAAAEASVTTGLAYFDWAAVDEADPADPDTWRGCMPALGHTVDEEAVSAAFQTMARHEFERAYLNRWTSAIGDPVVPLDVWESLADPDAPRPAEVVLGVDIAPRSRSAAIAVAGRSGSHLMVSVLEAGPGTDWVAGKLRALREEFGGGEVVLDRRACAAILPELDDLEPTETGVDDMAVACGFLVDLVGRDALRHRGEKELAVALDGAAQRPLGDSWGWSRRRSGVDISPLVAATLACWAWHSTWSQG